MELWLSIVGFLVVIGIIVSIMTKKLSTMVALSVIPLIGAILVGQFTSIPAYLAAGISKVAVNGVMFVFAILFFGTMMTAGAFDPIVKFIIKCCRGNPLYVCIGTYVLSIVGHLDGSATTTVLLVCGAMIPIYQKMHMRLRNLAAILAMAAALEESCQHMEENMAHVTAMRDKLTEGLSKIPYSRQNGDPGHKVPGIVSFCFEGIEGESLLLRLDLAGICASSGSACTSGSLDPSHVLLALGMPHEIAHGSLRLSLCEYNTMEQVDYILEQVPRIVRELRQMSPVWMHMMEHAEDPYKNH